MQAAQMLASCRPERLVRFQGNVVQVFIDEVESMVNVRANRRDGNGDYFCKTLISPAEALQILKKG